MTLRNLLLTGLAAVTLTACSSKPAPDLYVLRAPDTDAQRVCTFTHDVVLDRPTAPNEYDTKRIAVMLDHNHLSYYTGAGWASPFPEQLQGFMSDALTARGVNVLDSNMADTGHASPLHLAIREADVTNIDAPVVRLRLTGTIAGKHFKVNETVPAAENHMPQIVDAYDVAASHAADTIVKTMKARCPGVYAGD
jgi:ABC-type uncharacterized transport system auxiliary subunit